MCDCDYVVTLVVIEATYNESAKNRIAHTYLVSATTSTGFRFSGGLNLGFNWKSQLELCCSRTFCFSASFRK